MSASCYSVSASFSASNVFLRLEKGYTKNTEFTIGVMERLGDLPERHLE